jgi:hypothetical protein
MRDMTVPIEDLFPQQSLQTLQTLLAAGCTSRSMDSADSPEPSKPPSGMLSPPPEEPWANAVSLVGRIFFYSADTVGRSCDGA